MNPPPPPPHQQLGFASSSRPLLDLNVPPTEESMEIDGPPPAAAAAPRPRQPPNPAMTNTVQRIFSEYACRRAALISAITTDEEELFRKCDPSLEPVHLYGHTDGSWEVRKPEHRMPPRQPEPALGINLERDKMERVQWLQEIAKHCDAWLISVSFFIGAKLLNADGREHLFNSINSLQTVYEAFIKSDTYCRLCHENKVRSTTADEDEPVEDKDANDSEDVENDDDNKEDENENNFEETGNDSEEVEDNNDSFCEMCGDRYHANGFWIRCDICKGWYHGRCVKINQDQAKYVKHYTCLECNNEKSGHDYD